MGSRRRARAGAAIPRTRLRGADIFRQALASISARPGRTIMTMLGTVLGIGAFVTVLGLTATASGQISETFSALRATEVVANDTGKADIDGRVWSFPDNADEHAREINGVSQAGTSWNLPRTQIGTGLDPRNKPTQLSTAAATPGYLRAVDPTLSSGTLITEFQNDNGLRVAVLGSEAAQRLGISSARLNPTIFIDDVAFTVIGIISQSARQATALSTVFIPARTGRELYGEPASTAPASMLVVTDLGAAEQVAAQLPAALRPDQPDLIRATPSQASLGVQDNVYATINPVFLALAALTLLIGTIGIANTTLIAVVERNGEIGLRRALGARPRDIHIQILCEAALTGTIGGLIGTAIAVATVVITALSLHWTAILDPLYTVTAPFLGTVTGALAGLYPAARASRISPIDALRR